MAKVRTKMSSKKRRTSKAFSSADRLLAKGKQAKYRGEGSKARSQGKAEVILAKAKRTEAKAGLAREKAKLASAKQGAQKTKYRATAATTSAISAFENAGDATKSAFNNGNKAVTTDQMVESGLNYSTPGREETDSEMTGIDEFNNFYR